MPRHVIGAMTQPAGLHSIAQRGILSHISLPYALVSQ
jgi:hypothetical protein